MRKEIVPTLMLIFISTVVCFGQGKYFSRDGKVSFHCESTEDKVEAINKKATCVIDTDTGNIQFSILMKAFEFHKALMEEHFNENYVESDKFPKTVFKGIINNNSDIDWSKDGEYPAKISGQMTIHGITNKVVVDGKFIVTGESVNGTSGFKLRLSDYDIEIPKVVRDKISEEVSINVDVDYQPLKK